MASLGLEVVSGLVQCVGRNGNFSQFLLHYMTERVNQYNMNLILCHIRERNHVPVYLEPKGECRRGHGDLFSVRFHGATGVIRFVPLYDVCYVDDEVRTIYSQYTLYRGTQENRQPDLDRIGRGGFSHLGINNGLFN